MKQIIGLLLLGLTCCSAVPVKETKPSQTGGVSQSGRIINGPTAYIENLRYPLSLWVDRKYAGGASIITGSHALTAAHCVVNATTRKVTSYYDVAVLTVATNAFAGHGQTWRQLHCNPRNCWPVQVASPVAGVDMTITFSSLNSLILCIIRKICALNDKNMETCVTYSGSAVVCGGRLTGVVSRAIPSVFTKIVGPNIRNFIRTQACT
uniref:Uncharacterized protein n=1 Tax=Anopheles stephensi TaxID=30069 RepID=A0A182XYA5_ANOST